MIDLDYGACCSQRRLLGDFLHRKDGAAGNLEWVECFHDLHLGHGHSPLLDFREYLIESREACLRCAVIRIRQPILMTDNFGESGKSLCLGDYVNVSVGIRLPTLAPDDPTRVASS